MGKFSPGEIQATRERPTPATLSYLGAGLLHAAEAHSVICSPFSETSFLPQLSDTDHSLLCSRMAPWMWVKSANTSFQAISGDLTAEHFNFLGGVSHKLAKSFKTRNKNVFQVAALQ